MWQDQAMADLTEMHKAKKEDERRRGEETEAYLGSLKEKGEEIKGLRARNWKK